MKIAVCIKHVPVVSRIQFDYETKTIVREGVPSEVNSYDLLGVDKAVAAGAGTWRGGGGSSPWARPPPGTP